MRNGEETRGRIREAALRLFVERGVDAVAIRDIAGVVGIQVGTLYVHWKSKDALIEELFRSGFESYSRRLAPVLQTSEPFARRLDAFVQEVCAIHDEDVTLFAFLLLTQHRNLASAPPGENNPVSLIYRAIEQGLAEGEILSGDPIILTSVVLGAIVQTATFRLYGHTDRPMLEMAGEISAYCGRALGLREDRT